MTQKNKLYLKEDRIIIAIGASAGGMEALHLLFDNTLKDGISYVLIQHLSPDHLSVMADLLAQHSNLQILVAKHSMFVEPNCVYLIPQAKNMTIKNGVLLLTDIKPKSVNNSIDIFFISLAESHGDKSIAILLSGTGSDGTKGIAAIKKNGGLVIVQDPESSKFNGMPKSAINSGNVDIILFPESIPEAIINYLKRGIVDKKERDNLNEKEEDSLLNVFDLIQEHTPLDFSGYKRPTIFRKIFMRMAKNQISSLEDYAIFLKSNPDEINKLAKEFMISVTKFFRDYGAYELIKSKVIPEIVKNKLQVDTFKVWVVGCATGEEAYSHAILIMEYLTEFKINLEVKIFASDIDKSALIHASKGIYPESISNDVSEQRLHKFFIKRDKTYQVRDNIRKMIIFAEHDIVKQPPYGKIDLISCRNLFIYLNPKLQQRILASLHFCLNVGGYLFLGPSERLGELKNSFTELDKKWKIYKSIEIKRDLRNTTYSIPGINMPFIKFKPREKPDITTIKNNLADFTIQTLMEKSEYDAGLWVNSDFEIIQTYGNYEKYLLPKMFNFNLLEMLPEELSIATSTTFRKAIDNKDIVIVKEVTFLQNGKKRSVNVFVKPVKSENEDDNFIFLVLYSDDKMRQNNESGFEVFSMDAHTSQFLEDLKKELVETKEKLKEAYDELEASTYNISSYNEELISSNEEMQSTNEELQSINEELHTVNNEHQLKIKQLAELNDELNNYFKSTINAQLYVSRDLVLKKYTPSSVSQVNLKESDIGRVLSDISTNIRFSTLMGDIANVISSSNAIEKEVQTIDGRWYQMIALPYMKQLDNQIDGAIITFSDITELKKVQHKLSRINADHDTFIYAVSHDLKGPLANLSALISFVEESVVLESKEDREIMSLIHVSISNLNHIIAELSDLTKIENEIDVKEKIDVNLLMKEVEFGLKDQIEKSKAIITIDLKVQEIPFSKKNLRGILTNLLSNAVKYKSPERVPEVTIKTETSDDFIMLTVQDNGLGIPIKKKNKIFGRFQRAHHHVEGSGIGLYLVKKLINNAGGDIEVDSELGKGSVFKVYFKK